MNKLNRYLLLFNLSFLQSYLLRFSIGPFPTNLQQVLILLQIIVFFISFGFSPLKNLKNHRAILTLAGLTGLSFLTHIPLLISPNTDFIRHFLFLFFACVLAFIFLETFKSTKEKKYAATIAGYGAIAFGIFSLIFNLLGHNVAYDLRLLGPLDAAVYLAYYLAPFFILFSIEKKYLPAILCALLILATQSMGAIAASFIILAIYFFKQSKFPKLPFIIIGIFIAALTFYFKILPAFQTNYSSLNERGEIWQTSFELLKEPKTLLTGLGLGQFQTQYASKVKEVLGREPLDYVVLQPHNIFLLFIFQFGILGLAFIIFTFVKTLKLENLSSYILLYFLLHGLIDTPLFKNDLLFIFVLLLSLTLNRQEPHKSQ